MLDCTLYIYVGRHGFGLVNPLIRTIEGRVIKVLLYIYIVDMSVMYDKSADFGLIIETAFFKH